MKHESILYSAAAPVFMLLFMPRSWLYLLPLNLLVMLVALYFTLKVMERPALTRPYVKKHLFLLWISGFIGDLVGAGVLYWLQTTAKSPTGTWAITVQCLRENPFLSTNALIIVFGGILVAAAVKYLLFFWLALRSSAFIPQEKRAFCLYMAMFTAPYTFIVPGLFLSFLV